jgi:hypothetical protein
MGRVPWLEYPAYAKYLKYLRALDSIPWRKRGTERNFGAEKRALNGVSPDVFLGGIEQHFLTK